MSSESLNELANKLARAFGVGVNSWMIKDAVEICSQHFSTEMQEYAGGALNRKEGKGAEALNTSPAPASPQLPPDDNKDVDAAHTIGSHKQSAPDDERKAFEEWYEINVIAGCEEAGGTPYHPAHATFGSDVKEAFQAGAAWQARSQQMPVVDFRALENSLRAIWGLGDKTRPKVMEVIREYLSAASPRITPEMVEKCARALAIQHDQDPYVLDHKGAVLWKAYVPNAMTVLLAAGFQETTD